METQLYQNNHIIRRFLSKKKINIASLLFLIVVAGSAYGVYQKFFNLTPAEKAQKELAKAVAAVSALMVLPEGDEPVLAIVTDADSLKKQQAFFSGAVKGDQLLLFPKNMKAVIYSPSRNKIINAGPIEQQSNTNPTQNSIEQIQNNNPQSSASVSRSLALKVAFYNGTKNIGLANEMETKLKENFSDFETVVKTNAAKNYYKETIVVDLTGGAKLAEAQDVAAALGAKISVLPQGETKPVADILIIAGR